MTNPLNSGLLIGRVTQDIVTFPNTDGSKTLLVTIAVEDNFPSGPERKAATQFIPVRVFIPKTGAGESSWKNVHKGDLIAIQTRVACAPYQKNGETIYPSPTIEADGFPQYLESKAIVDARAARNALAAAAPAPVPANETAEQTIARLEAQLAAQGEAAVDYDNTSPYATAGV